MAIWLLLLSLPARLLAGGGELDLDYLLGTWHIPQMNMYESWEKTDDGYAGKAYYLRGGEESIFELFTVAQEEGTWQYITDINGQGPTTFTLVEANEKGVLFENPEHDMPQSIHYMRDEAGSIKVRLQGNEGGQEIDLTMDFKKVNGSAMAGAAGQSAQPSPSPLGRYAHISIGTRNMGANRQFYETLGFKVTAQDNYPWPWIMLSDGSVNIQLNDDGMSYFGLNYFDADMAERVAAFKKRGIVPMMVTEGDFSTTVVVDPDSVFGFGFVAFDMPGTTPPVKSKGALGTMGAMAIPVSNLDSALAWYTNLGFTEESRSASPYPWAILSDGLVELSLHQSDHFSKPSLTYFSSDSKAHIQRLTEAGMMVKSAMPGGDKKEMINGVVESPDGWPVNIFNGEL
jgi:catechol 2,3-dioxygenase-like lactoylglutathione lyase family enzyme